LGGGPPRFRPGFTCPALLRDLLWTRSLFAYRTITFYGLPFQGVRLRVSSLLCKPCNPNGQVHWFGHISPFARRYLGNHFCFLFLCLLRCFSSASLASQSYEFRLGYTGMTLYGLPHSDTPGSTLYSSSPRLFAGFASFFAY
jgi:hypothetical protein